MINILTDSLPKTVSICGKDYPINSDFRAAVEFEILIQSDASPRKKKTACIGTKLRMMPARPLAIMSIQTIKLGATSIST